MNRIRTPRVTSSLSTLVLVALMLGAAACGDEAMPGAIDAASRADTALPDVGDAGADAASDDDADSSDADGSDAEADIAEDAADADVVETDDGGDADTAPDSDAAPDTSSDAPADTAAADADADADADAEPMDADPDGEPAPGFGTITGDCGVLDTELTDDSPHWFEGAIDFGDDPFDEPDDTALLTAGGQRILEDGNLGGSSLLSEVFAFEVLARCEDATLLETERSIPYQPGWMGSLTDLLVEIDGVRLGVSVTRAVQFPFDDPYPPSAADALLRDKLEGVNESSTGVADEASWPKQILFVVAYAPGHVATLRAAWDELSDELRADTVLWVSASEGADGFLY